MSNTVIQLKRSSATGNVPSVGDINHGELFVVIEAVQSLYS